MFGGEEFGGWALMEAAFVHANGVAHVAANEGEIVRDEHHGHVALGLDFEEEFENALRRGGVDAGGGFVENQDLRIGHQGAGDEGALFLAAGELREKLIRKFGRACEGEHAVGAFANFAAEAAAGAEFAAGAHHRHVVSGKKIEFVEGLFLRNVTDDARAFGVFDFAAQRRENAGNRFEQSGFASAVGTEDGVEAAPGDFEIERSEKWTRAIAHVHFMQFNGRGGHLAACLGLAVAN